MSKAARKAKREAVRRQGVGEQRPVFAGNGEQPHWVRTRAEWERLHGASGKPSKQHAALGWTWQPAKCQHPTACVLDLQEATQ